MAPRKTERLMNLMILLLSSRHLVSRDQIWRTIEGYRDLNEMNFEATFERDKKDLRAMGVPLETGLIDAFFDDETGYRIARSDFELPPIDFTAGESIALGLAAEVWQQATTSEQTASALAKLRAAGIPTQTFSLPQLTPRLSAKEPTFDIFYTALSERQAVKFGYRDAEQPRRVQPWRLAWRNNSWYLLGFDLDRQASRVFKLSRISAQPVPYGPQASYQIPSSDQLAEDMASLIGPRNEIELHLAIKRGRAPALRRAAASRGGGPLSAADIGQDHTSGPTILSGLPEGYQLWRVSLDADRALDEVIQYGADVLVLAPEEMRLAVIDRLASLPGGTL